MQSIISESFSKEITILPSITDNNGRLSKADTFALLMDVATLHSETLGIGPSDMLARNLFWLTVATRLRFVNRPKLMDRVVVSTWMQPHQMARCVRDYSITSPGGEVLVYGKTDWAVMETDSRRLHSLSDVYPEGLTFSKPSLLTEPTTRFNRSYEGLQSIGTYKVRSVDIDIGGHMNNAIYVNALMGQFALKELKEMNCDDIEIVFSKPSFEGETLTYYKRINDDSVDILAVKEDGNVSMFSRIK